MLNGNDNISLKEISKKRKYGKMPSRLKDSMEFEQDQLITTGQITPFETSVSENPIKIVKREKEEIPDHPEEINLDDDDDTATSRTLYLNFTLTPK
jgi:hypothetical protein